MAIGTAAAVLGGAAIAGGASLYGASKSASAAKSAAETQARASRDATAQANALQRYMFDMSREDQRPYREKGYWALDQLQRMIQSPTSSPAYAFQLGEGQKAIERSAAARGGLLSGATGKSLSEFSQGLALKDYLQQLSPYQSLAGVGQTSTNFTGQLGANYANQASNNLMASGAQQGSAYAGGALGQANAFNQGLQGVGNAATGALNNWMTYNAWQNQGLPAGSRLVNTSGGLPWAS